MAKDVSFVYSAELRLLAEKLRERYYLYIGHVDLDAIFFAEKFGDKPKGGPIVELNGVTNPWMKAMLVEHGQQGKHYCLSAWGSEWSEMGPEKRQWAVFKLLCGVDPRGEGKLRRPDINDFGFILEYMIDVGVGPYWEKADILPDLLGDYPLPIPPPPDEEDTSDSTL